MTRLTLGYFSSLSEEPLEENFQIIELYSLRLRVGTVRKGLREKKPKCSVNFNLDYSLMKILKARMVPVKLQPIMLATISGKS